MIQIDTLHFISKYSAEMVMPRSGGYKYVGWSHIYSGIWPCLKAAEYVSSYHTQTYVFSTYRNSNALETR